MSVLVVGEALVDLIVTAEGALQAVPGGGPFNQARTIARLGISTTFASGISDDVFGRKIASLLDGDEVTRPVSARNGLPTTLALAELDASGAANYHFYIEGTAAPEVRPVDLPALEHFAALAVGSLGLVHQPIAATVETTVAAAPDSMLVMVDPNCREGVIRDPTSYRARLDRIIQRCDVLKVSADDLRYLNPNSAPIDTARRLIFAGPRVVLFTDGAESVQIVSPHGEVVVPVPLIDVIDTVGAGDAFGGAFLAFWLLAQRSRADLDDLDALRATVKRAIDVASITCRRPGANPPRLAELDD